MSYLTFHVLLILPPILGMYLTLPRPLYDLGGRRAQLAIPLVALIAFSYTTPWDNYRVARKVWWYGPDRVLATIGHVPVEEYLFFLLQPVLTGLFFFQYLGRVGLTRQSTSPVSAWGGFGVFTVLAGLGGMLLSLDDPSGMYMGLVLSWAAPILAGMWLYDGETLWQYRSALLYTVGLPTLYLWVADATAITAGIWTISSEMTLGVSLVTLPLEEATFFLVTNLLVVKGILLLLYGNHDALE